MIFILLILKYQKKFFVSVIRIKAAITKSNFEQLVFCLVDNESTIYAVWNKKIKNYSSKKWIYL